MNDLQETTTCNMEQKHAHNSVGEQVPSAK